MIIVDLVIIFGSIIGYIPQYKLIRDQNSLGNFSILTCAILLLSNILRLFYWYAVRFSIPLLIQAILMIVVQIILLELCIRVRNQQGYQVKHKTAWSGALHFWKWNLFQSYMLFLAIYTFVLGLSTSIFVDGLGSTKYGQAIGFFSLSIEALLGFPQMIRNFKTKSVQGISLFLILTWFIGDFFKTIYFIINKQPVQFIFCGSIQLIVDLIILIQLILYREKNTQQVPNQSI